MLAPANSSENVNISMPPHHPPSDADIERILDAFERFMSRLVTSHAAEFAEVDVTMAQAKVLYVVIGAESLRMSELAARLGISMSTASGAVERLVDVGLIERRADPADRRQVIVAATPAGIDVLQRMRELNTRQMRALLERMTASDLAVIERSIEIFAAAAAAELPATRHTDQPAEREPS